MPAQHPEEIERKFIVEHPPNNYTHFPHKEIEQGYFNNPASGMITRIRRKGLRYYQTEKQGTGLVRTEIEVELSEEQYLELWPLTEGWRLEKVRYEIPYHAHVIELDVYKGPLSPFVSAEVEFESVKASQSFSPPKWMTKEVTEDPRYSNAELAKNGLPNPPASL